MILYLCCFNTASAGKWPRHTKKTDGCRFCGSSAGAHAYQGSLGWFSLFDWWWEQWVTDHLVWFISLLYCIFLCVFFLYWPFFFIYAEWSSHIVLFTVFSFVPLILCQYLMFLLHLSSVQPPTQPPIMSPTISTSPTYLSRTIFSWRHVHSSSDSSCCLTLSGDSTQLYF